MREQKSAERTDREYIARVIHASPFADNEAGIPQMVQLIKALETQRDAAKAELAELLLDFHLRFRTVGTGKPAITVEEAKELLFKTCADNARLARKNALLVEVAKAAARLDKLTRVVEVRGHCENCDATLDTREAITAARNAGIKI